MAVHSQDPALLLELVDEALDAPADELVLLVDDVAAPEDVAFEDVDVEDVELEELELPERESVR